MQVESDEGVVYLPLVEHVGIEDVGPVRVTVRVAGRLVAQGRKPLLTFVVLMSFFVDSATVRVELTLTNPRRAGHPGGCWDLGNQGSVLVRDASLTLAMPPGAGPDRHSFLSGDRLALRKRQRESGTVPGFQRWRELAKHQSH